jgi:DNA polymerase-3 subunit alpha
MSNGKFVHLHLHTGYSLGDGIIKIPELMKRVAEMGMGSAAITDHGNLFGAVHFYEAARKTGIQPVIGCEVYVAPGDRRDKTTPPGEPNAYHLVLLAENLAGYRNLLKLVSAGYLEGFHRVPRVDLPLLQAHCQGLIALSGCSQSRVTYLLRQGREEAAEGAARELAYIFRETNFFIELQNHGEPGQASLNQALVDLSYSVGVGLVATNNCHFLRREDYEAHEILLCTAAGKTVASADRPRSSPEPYVKSPEEMEALFGHLSEALGNTVEIAHRCDFELPAASPPRYPHLPLKVGEIAAERLCRDARVGLERRLKELAQRGLHADTAFYAERLERELGAICQQDVEDYFLVVADYVNWAKQQGIPVGPGRGAAPGSLVNYALRITDIDPVAYRLLFERFLNPEQSGRPYVSVDFSMERRDEVLSHLATRHGSAQVAHVITFGVVQLQAAIREAGRALDLPYRDVDRLCKLIPHELNLRLDDALEREHRLEALRREDSGAARVLNIARRLEGLPRHISTHAAGLVISDRPITEDAPVCLGPGGEVAIQFDSKIAERLGFVRFDFLGLRDLDRIERVVQLVRRSLDPDFDISRLDLADRQTLELLCRGDTTGVFQLESAGMRGLLARLRPGNFEDVIALVALYRPGPLESGMVDEFIERRHGRVAVDCPVPELEEVLKETYGLIVYEEQLMEIASWLAQVTEDKAAEVFDLLDKRAPYAFNKAHAVAYALIAFRAAYLKTHYPAQWRAATEPITPHPSENKQ